MHPMWGRALQEDGTAKEGKACVNRQQENPLRRVAGRFILIDKQKFILSFNFLKNDLLI